jgi:hypothetical protein
MVDTVTHLLTKSGLMRASTPNLPTMQKAERRCIGKERRCLPTSAIRQVS